MKTDRYKVLWTTYARVALREVYVDACYFANTGLSHYIFWGIDPDDE